MNMLGPCVNPAEPPVQLLGVAEARMLEPVAQTLAALGVERALVVHGGGPRRDRAARRDRGGAAVGGRIERLTIAPEDAGFERAPLDVAAGGGPEENAERLKALLHGQGTSAERQRGGAERRRAADDRGQGGRLARGRRAGAARRSARAGAGELLRTPVSRSAMAEGVLGEIVARKRADVAARLAASPRPRSRRGGACARAGPARRALHHGGEEGIALRVRPQRR